MQNVHDDKAWKGETLTRPSQHGMRRSCDACGRKKRRCDGGKPCSRCVRSDNQCKYSKRLWHQPDQFQCGQPRQRQQNDRDAVHACKYQLHCTTGALVEHCTLPFKRFRLRPSPATGLVGMQENAFLSDFFGCVGFLPLTDESDIREAMVKIMALAAPQQEAASRTSCSGEEQQFATLLDWGPFRNVSEMDQLPKDPSFSTFWSAVALGALSKGHPFQAVEIYSQLAREALAANRSGPTSAELAKASAILTYVHSCVGDMARFREYLELSERFLQTSLGEGSTDVPAGLPDLLLHFRKVGNVQDGPMDSSWANEGRPPQLDNVTTGPDLYRFVMRSFRAFDQAVYAKGRERCFEDMEHFYSCGPSHRNFEPNDTLPGAVSEAIAAVFKTTNALEFEPLQGATDRPSIRTGVGDLLINGALVFATAAKGDLRSTFEKLDRSIEVYERYPGLNRCMMGSHMSHMLLATLAAIRDSRARPMYDRLRATFNSCRASHALPMPPLDEWQGMAAVCSDLNCRAMEILMKSEHMKAFTRVSVNSVHDSDVLSQSSPHGDAQGEILQSAGVRYWGTHNLGQTPVPSGWTNKCAGKQNPAGDVCRVDTTLELQAFRSYPGSPSATESDNACAPNGLKTKARDPLTRSARIHHDRNAESEEGDVTAADWLEVSRTMLDAVHST